MVMKAIPPLPLFGKYLASLRKRSGIQSQRLTANLIARDLIAENRRFPEITAISPNQIFADEKGLISDIPAKRLKAYSIIYKIPFEQIVSVFIEEKYGIRFTATSSWKAEDFDIPESASKKEIPAYKILRNLLDTKRFEKVLEGLRLLINGIELKTQQITISEEDEEDMKNAG